MYLEGANQVNLVPNYTRNRRPVVNLQFRITVKVLEPNKLLRAMELLLTVLYAFSTSSNNLVLVHIIHLCEVSLHRLCRLWTSKGIYFLIQYDSHVYHAVDPDTKTYSRNTINTQRNDSIFRDLNDVNAFKDDTEDIDNNHDQQIEQAKENSKSVTESWPWRVQPSLQCKQNVLVPIQQYRSIRNQVYGATNNFVQQLFICTDTLWVDTVVTIICTNFRRNFSTEAVKGEARPLTQ